VAVYDEQRVHVVEELDHDLVHLHGPLSLATAGAARGALAKALAQRGRVVVDLSGLVLQWEPVVTLFTTALSGAGGWPVARLVLFGASPALRTALGRARVPDTVPCVAGHAAAVRSLDVRPRRVARHRDLPGMAVSAAASRLYLQDACAEWEVPEDPSAVAVQVVNELVSNAVEHARSSCRLTVAVDDRGLHLAVRDYDPVGVVRTGPVPVDAPHGRGLHLVALLSSGWGVSRHTDGKTVWAVVPLPGD
jgi:anti-sigma regulatory factor (Ser/Thr protein kinase)